MAEARRVLVTGGTGYVGRFVVERLHDAGFAVVLAGRSAEAAAEFGFPAGFRPFSLEPDGIGPALFEGIEALVHAAFHHVPDRYRGGEGDDPATFLRLNGEGSVRLFERARAAGVTRAVFLSSRAVYGPKKSGETLDEMSPAKPDTLYGQVKRETEQKLAELSDDAFCGSSLRVTGVYGRARSSPRHKWEALFADYLAGRPVPVRCGTEVHGRDVADAARLMLETPRGQVSGRVFNVSDLLLDTREILSPLAGATGCPHPPPPPADKAGYNEMTTHALRALGWRPGGRDLFTTTINELTEPAG